MTEDRLAVALLGTFESLRMAPTFARGRRDERAGHVRSLTVSSSLVVAQVRGPEDPRAFRSRIAVRAFGAAEWARVEGLLVGQARYAADLLAGRMPAGIGAVFAEAGLSLVPLSLDEVAMDCSCERWPMPCVHLAATLYALGRKISEDPFGAFAWRGRSRDELLTHLRQLRGALAVEGKPAPGTGTWGSGGAEDFGGELGADRDAPGDRASSGARGGEDDLGERLGDPAEFWGSDARPAAGPGSGRPGAVTRPDALLDQLDPPPLAQDGKPLVDLLRPAYRALPDE